MDLGLKDKVAVVTGPANLKGNGRGIALALAKEMCHVACLDIDLKGAEDAAEQIRATGQRSIALRVDQSDYQQVAQSVLKVEQELGPIDILVNNAALNTNVALIHDMSATAWDKELQTNLSGPFYFTKEILPRMIQRKWGRILNISSMSGIGGSAALAAYSSSKAGIIGLTKTTALEGARHGITANVLILGVIDTTAIQSSLKQTLERLSKINALRRFGTIEEVGGIAAFLVSEKTSFLTGSEIVMDGGQNLFVV